MDVAHGESSQLGSVRQHTSGCPGLGQRWAQVSSWFPNLLRL